MKKVYTEQMHEFICNKVKGVTAIELTKLVNDEFKTEFTVSAIRAYKSRHKLKGERGTGKPKGMPSDIYPNNVKKYILKNYIGIGPTTMAKIVNNKFGKSYTKGQMKGYYARNKFDSGLKGTEGIDPPNKGKKFPGTRNKTTFSKGNKPINYMEIGTERINSEGYVDIKIADPNKWRPKHRILWEKENGKIPGNNALIFADGNKLNLEMDNLLLVDRKELMTLNAHKLIQKDKELTKIGLIVAKIINKTSELKGVME